MKRIVIINASPDLLRVLSSSIENEGYQPIIRTYKGVKDLHNIQELRPDLILLDILTGSGDNIGWQILERLKQSKDTQSIPVIVSTADFKEVKRRQDFLTAHAVPVLLKPFSIQTLLEEIRKILSKQDQKKKAGC